MTINVYIQLSLGRIPVSIEETQSIRDIKKNLRLSTEAISHVPLGLYRCNLDGNYLSDESKTAKDCGVVEGCTIHFVKKSVSEEASLSTEVSNE